MIPFKTELAKLSGEILEHFSNDPSLKPNSLIKSIKSLQSIHESTMRKYAQLKVINNKHEAKLESQLKLTKHLEEKLTTTIKDKDDKFIELRSEILVLERKLEVAHGKLNTVGKDETVMEIECRELRERIIDNEKLLDMQISNNKHLEESNKQFSERIAKLEKEMYDYKEETQNIINIKNNELIDLRSRLSVIDQDYISKYTFRKTV